jgi:hypothetical protein
MRVSWEGGWDDVMDGSYPGGASGRSDHLAERECAPADDASRRIDRIAGSWGDGGRPSRRTIGGR